MEDNNGAANCARPPEIGTALNVRGNMKRELREKFPDMAADELEALAERLADIARVYALAMRAA